MCERVHVPVGACVHVGVCVGVWEKLVCEYDREACRECLCVCVCV